MAYRGHKVVCFTPAGRKRTMSILLDNLSRFTDIIDEYQVWLNTDEDQVEDRAWLESLPHTYEWVKLFALSPEQKPLKPKQLNTGLFYVNTVEDNTIYVRFDDDIIYVDDDFFSNLLDFRIDHSDYFLVMANIWNNAICSYIQQSLNNVGKEYGIVEEPYCMDPVGWRSGQFAYYLHNVLINHILNNTVDSLFFDHADLEKASRFSISCFAFFGKDFKPFGGVVGQRRPGKVRFDEEIWLTEVYPTLNRKVNTICGSALVAHYSFFAQRPYLDKTDILDRYRAIGRGRLSDSYYDLLNNGPTRKNDSRTIRPQVKLPPVSQVSNFAAAMAAEKEGYKIVEGYNKVEITFKGDVVKTLMGKMDQTITDQDVDRALANLWNSRHANDLPAHQDQDQPILN